MKIKELIEELKGFDQELEIRMAVNPHWPFGCGVSRTVRKDNILYLVDNGESEFIDDEKLRLFIAEEKNI